MLHYPELLRNESSQFPPDLTALKLGVALAIGLLIGFERQWSNKEFGVRTFSLSAMLGVLTSLLSPALQVTGMIGVIMLAVLLNVRDILETKSVEGTTSAALMVTFVLGVLSGEGHVFTAIAGAIVTTWLLSLKPQFRALTSGVTVQEMRSALLLGLFGFIIWPLLPNRFVDPWHLLQPRQAWLTVLIVASIGFLNYILLRLYGSQGVTLSAVLGGLVNSTAAVAELATTLPAAGMLRETEVAVTFTTVAMLLRNLALLAIFGGSSTAQQALLPMAGMLAVAGVYIWLKRRAPDDEKNVSLNLDSPISVSKVSRFGVLFLLIQIFGTLATRWLGSGGLIVVSLIGGAVSSASSTAAAANLVSHGDATVAQGAMAAVVTSMVSAAANLPLLFRQTAARPIVRSITFWTALEIGVGIALLLLEIHLQHAGLLHAWQPGRL